MRKILWFLLIAMVLALPAPALGAQDDPFANAQDSTDLAPSGATDQPFPSPHLCRGQSNLPHRSTHNPANVNGEARTYCRAGAVSYLWAQAQLWEKRWWGWDKVGTPVSNSTSQDHGVGLRRYGMPEQRLADDGQARRDRQRPPLLR
jgi:hypothetical protein